MKKSEKSENAKVQTKSTKVRLVIVVLVALAMAIIAGVSLDSFRAEAARLDQLLRVVVLELVGSDKLMDAGIETWPSIVECLDHFDNATSAIAILCGIAIALAFDGILHNDDSTTKNVTELKAAIKAQDAKLDKIAELIKLSEFLSDDKNASTLDEILEEVVTTRRMMEESVERDGYFDSDAADSPSATDD